MDPRNLQNQAITRWATGSFREKIDADFGSTFCNRELSLCFLIGTRVEFLISVHVSCSDRRRKIERGKKGLPLPPSLSQVADIACVAEGEGEDNRALSSLLQEELIDDPDSQQIHCFVVVVSRRRREMKGILGSQIWCAVVEEIRRRKSWF